jgi:hypothetical protein
LHIMYQSQHFLRHLWLKCTQVKGPKNSANSNKSTTPWWPGFIELFIREAENLWLPVFSVLKPFSDRVISLDPGLVKAFDVMDFCFSVQMKWQQQVYMFVTIHLLVQCYKLL